ncbi:hypothetical protein M378DRAFT_19148 [Amanita muscaria Koide BX008]|uniref:Uncharacterized protein n=1 Tax=Amanita muscaria (strain Koide BX008) TaxID=946122 RepID=A0A0C2SJT8_AMAMK|nr:hypothetical protein M378DRAFT_19148 [Amanita muscaria Koide BX008]
MPSFFKDKSKKDTGQNTIEPPTIRVEETPPELPREGSFRHKTKEKLQKLLSIRPSHSRAASRAPSERAKSQEHLPVLDAPANPNIGDKDRFVPIKNECLEPADRQMGSVDRASEEVRLHTEDTSANLPTDDPVAKDEIDKQVLQDVIQESKRQVEDMRTIGGGVQKGADYGTQSTVILDKADMAANFLKPLKAFDSVVKGLADVRWFDP